MANPHDSARLFGGPGQALPPSSRRRTLDRKLHYVPFAQTFAGTVCARSTCLCVRMDQTTCQLASPLYMNSRVADFVRERQPYFGIGADELASVAPPSTRPNRIDSLRLLCGTDYSARGLVASATRNLASFVGFVLFYSHLPYSRGLKTLPQ
ncbi:unnamed protein product [Protopolystoma xenopodis]|uniref:Uncharacterized protein n=1 Tax=Protopolystoma xenopodis TaxID=117903 RepID=A0A3S5BAY9_9PLAT|nr:unnamed protein product [Protopolystoma xenopodis]